MSAMRMTQKDRVVLESNRYRRIVFTLNNWTPTEYKWLTEDFKTRCRWIVIGKEHEDDGTPHLQGAAIFNVQYRWKTIKEWYSMRRAHFEGMNGTPQQSLVYCSKEDKNPFIFGELPTPGKRNDLHDACDAIREGASLRDIALDHGPTFVKFNRGLTAYKNLITHHRRDGAPSVYWLSGSTGSGKTRCSYEFAESLYPESLWVSNDSLQWFDGYDGQSAVIFDDFRAKGVTFNFLLRILDRYPLRVPIKGGFVEWQPKLIIITTPNGIRSTFSKRLEHVPEDIAQLERRVSVSFVFPDDKEKFLGLLERGDESPQLSRVELSDSAGTDESDSESLESNEPLRCSQ